MRPTLVLGTALLALLAPAGRAEEADTMIQKLTTVLTVERIEPSLPFWTSLGFEKTVEVPGEDGLGFAILQGPGMEIMLQSRASIAGDLPAVADALRANLLFLEVADLEAVAGKVRDAEVVVPRRKTFYGMYEIVVREPGGHFVILAQPVGDE